MFTYKSSNSYKANTNETILRKINLITLNRPTYYTIAKQIIKTNELNGKLKIENT